MARFDDPRLTAMGLIIEVHGSLTAELDRVHGQRGLSGTDFDTLIRLARSPDQRLRMTDLAAQTALSTSGITRIVDRLERRGLVRRQSVAVDRRSWLAVLTEAGDELLRVHVPAVVDTVERSFTGTLPPEQLDALVVALRTIRSQVRPDAAAGASGCDAG
jgi:DNA-binding MarR family transcriptional regulator